MRMEKGEPPSDDIEKEWLRKIRDEARKQQESEAARMVNIDQMKSITHYVLA